MKVFEKVGLRQSPGEKFHSMFEPTYKRFIPRIIFSLIVLVLVALGGRAYVVDYDLSKFLSFEISPRTVEFAFAFMVACCSSLIASFIFILVVERRETKSIKNLEALAPAEFFRDFVDNIAHYQGIVREDHQVAVKLRNHSQRQDLILCDLTYQYTVSRLPRSLSLKIFRMHDLSETDMVPLIADECLENEFVWYNGEYEFDRSAEVSDYAVGGLEVGNQKFDLTRTSATKSLIRYECDIGTRRTEPTFVKYRVTIPLEVETILTITSEFITRGSQLEFDFSELSETINPCIMAFAGIKENILHDDVDNRKLMSRRIDGWVLPRNGWVISWWRDGRS